MKNTIKIIGIIALLAVIGFSMVACDNGMTKSPLEGTWASGGWSYKFTGSDFSFTNPNVSYAGTFSYTDTTITFNRTDPKEWGPETWTQNYTITGKTLLLEMDAGRHFNGTFVKQ
jgi:hypothetical protein